jgi:hemolysin-activating ACP:hemolysin acyltransferase
MFTSNGHNMSIIALHQDDHSALRLFQHPNPAAALGLAVSHLMTKPAFARLPFGTWSRVLVGQINRRHYQLALDPAGNTIGFLGWAISDENAAEAWLAGVETPSDSGSGDCVIINAWSAETAAANRLLLEAARIVAARHRLIYFKRHYPDGSIRTGKLSTPDFVQGKRLPPARHLQIRSIK